MPAGCTGPPRHARPPLLGLRTRRGHQAITGAHGICPEVHYPVPGFATLAAGDWVNRIPRALAAVGVGLYHPIECNRAAHIKLQSPRGNVVPLCTAKLRHRDTCRLTVPHTTPWHGHHGPHHPSQDNDDAWPAAVRECLNQCANEHLHYCCREQGPTDHPGWRDALVNLFHTTGTQDPRLRLIHPTRGKQDTHIGPRVTLDSLHSHLGGYPRHTRQRPSCTSSATCWRTANTRRPMGCGVNGAPASTTPLADTVVVGVSDLPE